MTRSAVQVCARRLACTVWRVLLIHESLESIVLTIDGASPRTDTSDYDNNGWYTWDTGRLEKQNRPEAVRIMLPPLRGFPRASFVCFIAADACLTARKHLVEVNRNVQVYTIRHSRQSVYSHNIGEHLSGCLFQCMRRSDPSLGGRKLLYGMRGWDLEHARWQRKCLVCLAL
jgi:hypothetical protein